MDRSIRTQSKQRVLGTCPTYCGAEETAEERRFNSTVFWDTLFGKLFAESFFPGGLEKVTDESGGSNIE